MPSLVRLPEVDFHYERAFTQEAGPSGEFTETLRARKVLHLFEANSPVDPLTTYPKVHHC